MNNSQHLGEWRVKRLLLEFCIPSVLGLTATALFNIIYRILIIRGIGTQGLSAFSMCLPPIIIIMAFGGLVSAGSASMVSTRLGKGKKERSEIIMCNAILMVSIISIVIAVIMLIFIDNILKAISPSVFLRLYAKNFLILILISSVIQNVSMAINGVIRAEGSPGFAMFTTIISVLTNIFMAYMLTFIFHLGILSLGVAMLCSELSALIWVLYYFFSGRSYIKIHYQYFRLQLRVVKNILAIGFPSFLSRIMGSLITIVINRELAIYSGSSAIASASIISSISIVFMMPVIGINQGIQPLIGYNYGSKNYKRVKKVIILVAIISVSLTTFGFILCTNCAKQFISLFSSNNSNLNNITLDGLKISILAMPIFGIQIMAGEYFEAVGKYKHSLILTIVKNITYLIPLLILPKLLGLKGIWIANPLGDILYTIIGILFLVFEFSNVHIKH